MKLGGIIFNNFWAKLISLALAVATWFYVFDLVNSDSFLKMAESMEEFFSRYKFIVKDIPIKPVYYGESPEGYRLVPDKVKVDPATISVYGPEDILKDVKELETDRIILGEHTRSARLTLGLHSSTKFIHMGNKSVNVYLAIERIEKPAEQK